MFANGIHIYSTKQCDIYSSSSSYTVLLLSIRSINNCGWNMNSSVTNRLLSKLYILFAVKFR
jgi:hypothetical protein